MRFVSLSLLMMGCAEPAVESALEAPPGRAGGVGERFVFETGFSIEAEWRLVSAPESSSLNSRSLTARRGPVTSFVPDVPGEYLLAMTICDKSDRCEEQTVRSVASLSVFFPRIAPIANAQAPARVAAGTPVNLNGAASFDPDGLSISHQWFFHSVPDGSSLTNQSIIGRTSASASFIPDVEGYYTLFLRVRDGFNQSYDRIVVAAGESLNAPPRASMLAEYDSAQGVMLLDASDSYDLDGDPLTYKWRFDLIPTGSLLTNRDILDRFESSASFSPDVTGHYVPSPVVTDIVKQYDDGDPTDDFMSFFMVPY
jgi:hypothetical protein